MDDIKMKAWIDEYGDVVWNYNMPDWPNCLNWVECLHDGCRLDPYDEDVERINGLWMVLK